MSARIPEENVYYRAAARNMCFLIEIKNTGRDWCIKDVVSCSVIIWRASHGHSRDKTKYRYLIQSRFRCLTFDLIKWDCDNLDVVIPYKYPPLVKDAILQHWFVLHSNSASVFMFCKSSTVCHIWDWPRYTVKNTHAYLTWSNHIKGILWWDRRWSTPSIRIFPHTC